MTPVPDFTPEPMAPGLLVGCALSGLLIVGVIAWSQWGPGAEQPWDDSQQSHIRSGMEFPPLEIDKQRLEQARRDHHDDPDLSLIEEEIETLHTTFQRANLTQFPSHSPEEPEDPESLVNRLTFLADDILLVSGVRGFQLVGEPLFQECRRGLDELIYAIQRGNIPVAQALEDPPERDFARYRENCGNFLPFLFERELLSEEGEWNQPAGQDLVEILQRYRWADLVRSRFPVHYQLSPYELEIFFRWRIEDANAFSLPQRHQFLEQAKPYLSSDYDIALAETRLHAADEDPDEALQLFDQLVEDDPENEFYQAIRAQAERQARLARR